MIRKAIAIKLKHCSYLDVESITDGTVSFVDDAAWQYILLSKATITEVDQIISAGPIVKQSLSIWASMSTSKKDDLQAPQIFEVTLSSGEVLILGSKEFPCNLVSGKNDLGITTMVFERVNNGHQISD